MRCCVGGEVRGGHPPAGGGERQTGQSAAGGQQTPQGRTHSHAHSHPTHEQVVPGGKDTLCLPKSNNQTG